MTQKFSLPVEPAAHYWRFRTVELGRVTNGATAVIDAQWPYVGEGRPLMQDEILEKVPLYLETDLEKFQAEINQLKKLCQDLQDSLDRAIYERDGGLGVLPKKYWHVRIKDGVEEPIPTTWTEGYHLARATASIEAKEADKARDILAEKEMVYQYRFKPENDTDWSPWFPILPIPSLEIAINSIRHLIEEGNPYQYRELYVGETYGNG